MAERRGRQQPTIIDARGLQCPQPVLKARLALADRLPGDVIELWCTDAHATIDVEVFCQRTGHVLIGTAQDAEGTLIFRIEHRPALT